MTKDADRQPTWKSRHLKGGDWKADAESAAPQKADRTIPVKMTVAEVAEFDAAIEPLGLKRNRALRIAARRIAGFMEADPETLAVLKDIQAQISGIATNVNQIAKAANRTHDPDFRAFMAERRDLGKELARVDGQLRKLTNAATRRSDGQERLKKAAAS
ncbi:DNA mobilization endonuclease VirD1/MobC family subunit (plasmid) [Acuticoccus sp. MNP-M23]|uniref:DNA mobilization endonuclease VirD1/MobC family subunit n=1 Tax=Acuticoccus sp. MNP-M23 TaxID=3072793 RepID=UPI002815A61E|nr:DNA mobilization endonuclease VirD1/MobC family subunit [Acuticoccus sp. MNP-M23]WMS45232.1 DNA mobilization endonuclease VirD1/MobC family subunit [Acuticoccus sp. MNP-M23]